MNEWLILAGTTAKTSGDHIRGILAMILIPAVIIVIAVLAGLSGKKKKAKFMETLSKEHPFKESYKNVHITEDKLLIIESANVGKVYNNSCLINGNNNNKLILKDFLADKPNCDIILCSFIYNANNITGSYYRGLLRMLK